MALLVHSKSLLWPIAPGFCCLSPLSQLLYDYLPWLWKHVYLNAFIGLGFLIVEALLFNHIVNQHHIMRYHNYVVALMWVIYSGLFPIWLGFGVHHLAMIFLLLVLDKVMDVNTYDATYGKLFDMALLLGVGSLFYFPLVYFMIFLIITLIMFSVSSWREMVIPLLGFLFPFFVCFAIAYLCNSLESTIHACFSVFPLQFIFIGLEGVLFWISALLILFMMSYGIIYYYSKYFSSLILLRKFMKMFSLLIIICMIVFIFNKNINLLNLYFILIPATLFSSYYLYHENKTYYGELLCGIILFWIIALNIT